MILQHPPPPNPLTPPPSYGIRITKPHRDVLLKQTPWVVSGGIGRRVKGPEGSESNLAAEVS